MSNKEAKRTTVTAAHGSTMARIHPDAMTEPHIARRLPRPEIDPNEPHETCTVANGRCIDQPVEGAAKEISGYDITKAEYCYRLPTRRFKPGEQIELPVSEARRLRGLGFVLDESGAPVVSSSVGPMPAA